MMKAKLIQIIESGFWVKKNSQIIILAVFFCYQNVNAQDNSDSVRIMKGHNRSVSSVCFSNRGKIFASSGFDNTVRIWDVETRRCLKVINNHKNEVYSISFSSDDRYLASSGYDHKVIILETKKWSVVKIFQLESYSTSVKFSSYGLLAVATQDAKIIVIDISKWKIIQTLDTKFPVNCLTFSPDGKILASGGPVVLWDTKTWQQLKTLPVPGGINCLAFSQDSRYLVSAHMRGVAIVYDLKSEKILFTLEAKTKMHVPSPTGNSSAEVKFPVAAASFSPDGKYVATAGSEKLIRIWDLETGNLKKSFEGHNKSIVSLCYSLDGKKIISGSLDHNVCVWKVQ